MQKKYPSCNSLAKIKLESKGGNATATRAQNTYETQDTEGLRDAGGARLSGGPVSSRQARTERCCPAPARHSPHRRRLAQPGTRGGLPGPSTAPLTWQPFLWWKPTTTMCSTGPRGGAAGGAPRFSMEPGDGRSGGYRPGRALAPPPDTEDRRDGPQPTALPQRPAGGGGAGPPSFPSPYPQPRCVPRLPAVLGCVRPCGRLAEETHVEKCLVLLKFKAISLKFRAILLKFQQGCCR